MAPIQFAFDQQQLEQLLEKAHAECDIVFSLFNLQMPGKDDSYTYLAAQVFHNNQLQDIREIPLACPTPPGWNLEEHNSGPDELGSLHLVKDAQLVNTPKFILPKKQLTPILQRNGMLKKDRKQLLTELRGENTNDGLEVTLNFSAVTDQGVLIGSEVKAPSFIPPGEIQDSLRKVG